MGELTQAQRIAASRKHYETRASRYVDLADEPYRGDSTAYDIKGMRLPGSVTLTLRAIAAGVNLSGC